MGEEELGFDIIFRIGALTIPPLGTVSIKDMARATRNFDIGSGDRDQRPCPFLVSKGGGAFKDNLITIC